jgi:hypothetical protein
MTRLRPAAVPAALLLAVAAFAALPLHAEAQVDVVPFGQGTHAFRRILHDLDMQPLSKGKDLYKDPSRTLLVVLGDTSVLARIPEGLRNYLNEGGAALVATDRHWEWQADSGAVVVRGEKVLNYDDEKVFGHLPECPFVKGIPQRDSPLFRTFDTHSLQPGLHHVATNRPSYLQNVQLPRGMSYMARFVEGCVYGGRWQPREDQFFAAGGDLGGGRLLVLADHSVFINDMMLQDKQFCDNIDFTYNCIDWLAGAGHGRDRVLFVEEGEIKTVFDIPLSMEEPRLPPLDAIVPVLNEKIAELEDKDALNQLLQQLMPARTVLTALVLLLTAGLAAYGFYRIARARHRVDPWAPRLDALLRQPATARTLIEQRHRTLLSKGNLWEPARAMIRQAFEAAAAPRPNWQTRAPVVCVDGRWWRARRLKRLVQRLWHVAYGSGPVLVSGREFRRLEANLAAVQAALADGSLRLEFPTQAPPVPVRPAVREESAVRGPAT